MGREVFARQKMTHHFTCPTSTADKAQMYEYESDEIKPCLLMRSWTDTLPKLSMGGKESQDWDLSGRGQGMGAIDRGSTIPLVCGTPHGMASRGQGTFFL